MAQMDIDANFIGLDVFHDPAFLSPQHLTRADNVFVNGGVLESRPGKVGLLSSPMSAAIYEPTPYVDANGNVDTLFVSGGKLYKNATGSEAATEVKHSDGSSLSLVSEDVRTGRLGKFVYLVDGTGPLVRTDASTGQIVTGMVAPSAVPNVALTSFALDTASSTTGWSCDTLAGATNPPTNLFTNGDFTTGLSEWPTTYLNGNVAGGFVFTGPDVDFHTTSSSYHAMPSAFSGNWALLDDPGSGLIHVSPLLNLGIEGDSARFCRQFYASANYYQGDTTGLSGVRFELCCYSTTAGDESDLVALQYVEISPSYTSTPDPNLFIDHVFSIPDLGVEIQSVRLGVYGASTNVRGNGVFVDNVVLNAIPNGLSLTSKGSSSGLTVTHSETTSAYYGKVGGCRLVKNYGSAQDWSAYDLISIALQNAATLVTDGMGLVLGFWNGTGTTHAYSNPMTFAADGSYVSVDISTVPARSSFQYLEIVFMSDIALTSFQSPLFAFGPISAAGSLSVGYANYAWYFTEVDVVAAGDQIESNPSPSSVLLTPTLEQAQATVGLPASTVNAAATEYAIYRSGGTYSDGLARLVATVSLSADSSGAGYLWSHSTQTLTDNVPDSALYLATTMVSSRNAPPTGAQAVAAWQGRLWLAVGSMLYCSWLVAGVNESALYFTEASITGSSTILIEGAVFPIGGTDDDPIQALIPFGTPIASGNQFGGALLVLKQRRVWLVQGSSAENFSVTQYGYGDGVGLIAPLAVAQITESQIAFLGPDRIHLFPPKSDVDVSLPIEPLIYPRAQSETISATAISQCWMTVHDRRLFLGAPTPGDSQPTVVYVFDLRQGGWTVWKPFVATSGVSVPLTSATGQTYQLAVAGSDGQLYAVDGSATTDVALAGGGGVPIAVAVTSRGHRAAAGGFADTVAVRAFVDVSANDELAVTVTGDDAEQADVHDYTFVGRLRPEFKVSGAVLGSSVTVGVSGSVSDVVRIAGLGLMTTVGRQGR